MGRGDGTEPVEELKRRVFERKQDEYEVLCDGCRQSEDAEAGAKAHSRPLQHQE